MIEPGSDLELRLVRFAAGHHDGHRTRFEARRGQEVVTRSVAPPSESATGLLVMRNGDLAVAPVTPLDEPLGFTIRFPGPGTYALYLTVELGGTTAQATFSKRVAARRGPFGIAA